MAVMVLRSQPAASGLTDSDVHGPPGDYATFKPGASGFPALGATYVDPVFGTTIRRITDEVPLTSFSDIYSRNGWWNADASLFVHRHNVDGNDSSWQSINPTTGAVVRADLGAVSIPSDNLCDPVDAEIYYYYSGTTIRSFNLTTGATALVKNFGATLQTTGGQIDWIDNSGRYWVVVYSNLVHIWDKQTDTIYTGTVANTVIDAGGAAGITPDGNYLVINGNPQQHSYAINHGTQTLSTSGVMFWDLGGSHGDIVTASDGKNYCVTTEASEENAIYRVDITLDQSAASDAAERAANVKLLQKDNSAGWQDDSHISCVSRGTLKDWCFISMEAQDETFASTPTWRIYMNEIIAIKVTSPFTVRRLCHHRSRDVSGHYPLQPRVCVSWDGSKVAWASNFGYDALPNQYADMYVMTPVLQ